MNIHSRLARMAISNAFALFQSADHRKVSVAVLFPTVSACKRLHISRHLSLGDLLAEELATLALLLFRLTVNFTFPQKLQNDIDSKHRIRLGHALSSDWGIPSDSSDINEGYTGAMGC